MVTFRFHREALNEYTDAARYYLRKASPQVAEAFMAEVESAVANVVAAPTQWRVVEEPSIRRYVCRRFPYVLYYVWAAESERVTIYAVMHCSREPGYWKHRVG